MNKLEEVKQKLKKHRLIIVSNREPYTHYYSKSNKNSVKLKQTPGGLISALDPIMKEFNDNMWVAWGSGNADFDVLKKENNFKIKVPDEKGYWLKRIKLTDEEIKKYYEGFSNDVLWPNFHLFSEKSVFNENNWQTYKEVNKKFALAVSDKIKDNDIIWVHDYQLLLVPRYIKKSQSSKNSKIAFFLHIPFPPYEIFSHLCTHWNKKIMRSLLSCDMVGFHTKNDVKNFVKTAEEILGAKKTENGLIFENRFIKVKAFPISINYEDFDIKFNEERIKRKIKELNLENKKIIFGVDRLDYTKGILERLWAFKEFLEKNEEMRDKVVFVQITSPSRTKVKEYNNLKKKINEISGEINSKFRDKITGLGPVRYYYKSFTQKDLLFYYKIADVGLITPLADGMNLVAKEFIATSRKGVLILSECAGASKQLKQALIVNPRDIPEVAETIKKAINMNEKEKIERLNKLKENVKKEDIWWWLENFFKEWLE